MTPDNLSKLQFKDKGVVSHAKLAKGTMVTSSGETRNDIGFRPPYTGKRRKNGS